MMLITIVAVIPAYNEEIAIGSMIARAKVHVDEVLVIDDGSQDSTSNVAELIGATVIVHEKNAGKGAALKTAFQWAMAHDVSILVTLDADGQHNPDEIPNLLSPILLQEADLVNGARFLEGHNDVPAYRRIGQEVLTFATNLSSDIKINDSQSGFRAFSNNTFEAFKFNNTGMGIESEMIADAANAGLRIKDVPITCRYDVDGSTLNPVKHGLGVLNSIVCQLERKHPLLYFSVPGFVMFFVGIVLGFQTLYGYQSGLGFWVGKAMASMMFTILGSFGIFTGLILHSISTYVLQSNRD